MLNIGRRMIRLPIPSSSLPSPSLPSPSPSPSTPSSPPSPPTPSISSSSPSLSPSSPLSPPWWRLILPTLSSLHRQLRPMISVQPTTSSYEQTIKRVTNGGKANIAVLLEDKWADYMEKSIQQHASASSSSSSSSPPSPLPLPGPPSSLVLLGLTTYRHYPSCSHGKLFFIDDFIVHNDYRNYGLGTSITKFLREESSRQGCNSMSLQAGTERRDAHRFFFREGFYIDSLSFSSSFLNEQMVSNSHIVLPSNVDIVKLTNGKGEINKEGIEILRQCEFVHRQLRPQLPTGEQYIQYILNVCKGGPADIYVAMRVPFSPPSNHHIFGLMITRHYENTFHGKKFIVDDLVVDERRRSLGIGKALVQTAKISAVEVGANKIVLESGIQRVEGHRFYHKQHMMIEDYNFSMRIKNKK